MFPYGIPVQLREEFRVIELCCFCGYATNDGIYIRYNPSLIPCKGVHDNAI